MTNNAALAWVVIAWLAGFGAFGGALATLSEVPIRKVLEEGAKAYGTVPRLLWAIIVGALWGAGGSLSFSVILYLDEKLQSVFETPEKTIFLAGTAIAAGFAGIRILKLVSNRLEQQVTQAVDERSKEWKESLDKTQKLAEALSYASGVLARPDSDRSADPLREQAIAKLEAARQDFPTLRSIGIYEGRLYRALNENYPAAIKALTVILEARRKSGASSDRDDAALLFNRACYYAQEGKKKKEEPAEQEKLFVQGWNDIKESIKLHPPDLEEAITDKDLAPLLKPGVRDFEQLRNK